MFLEDSRGTVWVGTFYNDTNPCGSVASYDGKKWTEHKVKEITTKYLGIQTIIEDSNKRIWVGVGVDKGNGRIRSFDGETWTLYKPKTFKAETGPPNKCVTTITEDRDGNIWVGEGFRRGNW